MKKIRRIGSWLWICAAACNHHAGTVPPLPVLPAGIVSPAPANNPPTPEKTELGRYLFFDRRLSFNNTKSCASCHDPRFAFTDGYRRSSGATADMHQRNAQPVVNLLFLETLTAADTTLTLPEQQMQQPFFNHRFTELGVSGAEATVLNRLREDSLYQRLFRKAFPGERDVFRFENITKAIAGFIRTITSFNSTYDQHQAGTDGGRFTASTQRGERLFFSDALQCSRCHTGNNFSGGLSNRSLPLHERLYFNTGLYNVDNTGAYPAIDQGLYTQSHQPADMGKFRVPTLRNLAFTGPYMHDGSIATLNEVIDVYARGGRLINYGNEQGDGRMNPYKSSLIRGFPLSEQGKADLLNFLYSLGDSSLLSNPAYQNPFTMDETRR